MNHFHTLVFTFAFCAFVGWVYEVIMTLVKERKFISRGGLVGPFMPMYGLGAIVIIYTTQYAKEFPLAVFLIGMAAATLLEYLAAWILEVVFRASWWDYEEMRFNYKGRIALLPSMVWGLATLLAVYGLWPIIRELDATVYGHFGNMPYIVFLVYISVDVVFTCIHIAKFRAYSKRVKKGWQNKDGELDTVKYMRFLYKEVRDRSPFFSIKKFVLDTAPDQLKEFWDKAREKVEEKIEKK